MLKAYDVYIKNNLVFVTPRVVQTLIRPKDIATATNIQTNINKENQVEAINKLDSVLNFQKMNQVVLLIV